MLLFFERVLVTTSSMAKFFPRLNALSCISASSWGPCKESLLLLYKAFLRPLFTYVSLGWLSFLSVTNITKWNTFTERLVAPSPAAFCPPLFHISPRYLYLPYKSPGLIFLCHLVKLFVCQPFPVQVWPDLE